MAAIVLPGIASNYIPGTPGYKPASSTQANGPGIVPPQAPAYSPVPKPPSAAITPPKDQIGVPPTNIKGQDALSPLQKWLAGDTTYQQQLAEFNKSKSDYQTTYNTQTAQTQRDYNETSRQMNQQAQQDRMNMQNDFAGRGILHSGVYAQQLGNYNDQFNTQMNNLRTGENDKLGDLSTALNQFLQQLQLQMNAAKQAAIQRRAEQLGL